ncbi:MAG: CTP synthase [Treponema sp.]|nr:CTP synthase [Treponema sp.]
MNKFIFVSGGVCSSLGKGVAASSIGALLESRGLNVRMVKCDPYINVDAGTMSPQQHGEVYVTDDGAQTDLDLGNYARFTKGRLSQANSITTGQVYESVIRKEREGKYEGKCVQVIPHITDEIKSRILAVSNEENDTDVVIIEIGGTVGDIESIPFLEVARQMIHEQGKKNVITVHLTLIPEVTDGELKTKPTQHSVKTMLETGIQPDILICRAPVMLDESTRKKIAQFTNVDIDAVFTSPNIDTTIYQIPNIFFEQKLDQVILRKMGVESRHANMKQWHSLIERFSARKDLLRIGIVGKYMDINDIYTSLYEALLHASLECAINIELVKIESSILEKTDSAEKMLGNLNGILIPGQMACSENLNQNELNGLVKAAAWARTNKKPYLGINLGMYVMLAEWVRNVLNQKDIEKYKETTQLGISEIKIEENTRLSKAYGEKKILERYRHRYEFTGLNKNDMIKSGLIPAAFNSDGTSVECIEWSSENGSFNHPWGVAVQFHPEYKSKPMAASPLFKEFVAACLKKD